MAQNPFTTVEIQPSKTVKSELFEKTKNNIEDLDSRVSSLQSGSSTAILFQESWDLSSALSTAPNIILCLKPIPAEITVTAAKLTLLEKSTGYIDDVTVNGLELDVHISSGGILDVDFTDSLFTTKPYISFQDTDSPAAGDIDTGTFDGTKTTIAAGSVIRLVLSGMPSVGQQIRFYVELYA